MDWSASGSRRTEETNGGRTRRVLLDRRRGETSSQPLCTCTCRVHRQGKRNRRGLLPKREIWIKKKGMDILDFSPLLIIIEILVYTWSFRGRGEGKEEHYVCTILVSSLFLIYSKISSLLLYFLTFVIPLIFIAQLSHFLPFSKKITFLLSFFFFFFCLYIIWSISVIILREFSSIEKEN